MGVIETDVGSTVAVDPVPVDRPTASVGNTAGEPQPATEEEAAPAKKHAKLNSKELRMRALLSYRPRINCTMCDTNLRIRSSLLLTKHGLDTHLASKNHMNFPFVNAFDV